MTEYQALTPVQVGPYSGTEPTLITSYQSATPTIIIPGPPGPTGASDESLLQIHIDSPTPHPAYDDMPSMRLIFENGLV